MAERSIPPAAQHVNERLGKQHNAEEVTQEVLVRVVTSRLTGNSPGSPVNLRFFLRLEGDKIASLEIIP